jgi:hypothetical protein
MPACTRVAMRARLFLSSRWRRLAPCYRSQVTFATDVMVALQSLTQTVTIANGTAKSRMETVGTQPFFLPSASGFNTLCHHVLIFDHEITSQHHTGANTSTVPVPLSPRSLSSDHLSVPTTPRLCPPRTPLALCSVGAGERVRTHPHENLICCCAHRRFALRPLSV